MTKPQHQPADSPKLVASQNGAPPGTTLAPVPARTGDHHAIRQLLLEVFGGPSLREFQAEQDQPGYMPALRHVIREGSKVHGHIRLVPGEMQFPSGVLPVARVCDFAVENKYRRRGLGSALLSAAEQQAAAMGIPLVVARSDLAPFFERAGWFPCGQHVYSLAGPREILAELDRRFHARVPEIALPCKPPAEVSVRRWKQTEHAAIQRLYRDGIAGIPGPLVRSDVQWRWLINRDAYDWLYLAIEGPDHTTFDDIQAHIVGYMFVKGCRIVELMTASKRNDDASHALLTRACRDAIEKDASPLRIDAPSEHPFHALFAAAGGQVHRRECEANQWRLAKVLDWNRFVTSALQCDALSSPQPVEPCTLVYTCRDQERHVLNIVTGAETVPDQAGLHPHLTCSAITLAQLLLGHCTLAEAIAHGLLQVHQPPAATTLAKLLPTRSLWMPPLEEILAD